MLEQPPIDRAAIQEALSRVRMLWSDTRPDQNMDNFFGVSGLSVTVSTPESMEQAETEMPASMGALNDLLALTPYTPPCRGHLMDMARTFLVFGLKADDVLDQMEITFSDEDLGSFDPTQAQVHERAYLEQAVHIAQATMLPGLRQEQMVKLTRWASVYEDHYHDDSFSHLIK